MQIYIGHSVIMVKFNQKLFILNLNQFKSQKLKSFDFNA